MTSAERALPDPGPILIVGPVTWDHFEDGRVPGGAVTYAARVATAFGLRAHVLVSAGEDADLEALRGHEVAIIPGEHTLTYEHQFFGRRRELRVTATTGITLAPRHVPEIWPAPATLVLAPLLPGDVETAAWVAAHRIGEIALFAQGLQRRMDEDGGISIAEASSEHLQSAVHGRTSVFLSADEVAAWPDGDVDDLVARARRVVITRGRDGADIHTTAGIEHVPALPARRVDPTGAGDVFATAFILAVRAGERRAAAIASAYAAAAVERRGAAPLPPLQEIIATLDQSGTHER